MMMSTQDRKPKLPYWFEPALNRVDDRISKSTQLLRQESFASRCGTFSLAVDWHGTDGFTSWYEEMISQDNRAIATVRGECLQFWIVWIEEPTPQVLFPHLPSCQILIDCASGARSVLLDAESESAPVFRWLAVEQHPTRKSILAVEGRFDASPCSIKILDFTNVRHPKYRKFFDNSYSEFEGWVSNRAFRLITNVEVRSRDNKKLDDMSAEELASHNRGHDATHDIDEVLDVDVFEVLESTWRSEDSHPLIIETGEL